MQNFTLSKKIRAAVVAGTVALTLSAMPHAQPTGGRVLSDITVAGSGACKTARIVFSFPIRYINHFPQTQGGEVRIQLKPVAVGALEVQDALEREAFSPLDEMKLLNEVIYEGDMAGGPYLSLQFNKTVRFKVAQGTDFRSIDVSFHAPGNPETTCPESSPPA